MKVQYEIQGKVAGGWCSDVVGNDPDANTFDSEEEAWAAVEDLKKLGQDWAAGEYRVVELS